jgi:hypothetical protein
VVLLAFLGIFSSGILANQALSKKSSDAGVRSTRWRRAVLKW